MNAPLTSILLTVLLAASKAPGQGNFQPLHITFDGPPPIPPGSAISYQQYFESGMWFRPLGPIGPANTFGRVGAQPVPARPDDGSAYVQAAAGESLVFSFTNGSVFELVSVDLAEYSTVFPSPLTVHFAGYRADGSTVTTDLTTDGIIDGTGPLPDFQTFTFGPQFTDLTRVEIPTSGWSLDNLIVTPIPEPSTLGFFSVGALLFGWRLWRKRGLVARDNGRASGLRQL